ncbi:MAG: OadG family protein [Acidobacteriota bacterium]
MDNMHLTQGIEISIIGVSLVFAGLLLTFFMINLFSIIPKVIGSFQKKKGKNSGENTVVSCEDINEDHLAVIVTVLDIEFKMRSLLDKGRFTFK